MTKIDEKNQVSQICLNTFDEKMFTFDAAKSKISRLYS